MHSRMYTWTCLALSLLHAACGDNGIEVPSDAGDTADTETEKKDGGDGDAGDTGEDETDSTDRRDGGDDTDEGEDTADTGDPDGDPAIIVEPSDGITLDEADGSATFTIVLGSKPHSSVSIALTNTSEDDLTMDMESVVFTPENWNDEQTVTLVGIDNVRVDGDRPFVIITVPAQSDDNDYDGLNAPNIEGTVLDDDIASVSVQSGAGVATDEDGGAVDIAFALTSRPEENVTVPVAVSDETEAELSVERLLFTPENWDQEQTVTVTGLDDDESDGDIVYELVIGPTASDDATYDGLDPDDITIVNRDNDKASIRVSPSEITTGEDGGDAFFTVSLTVAPQSDVRIDISSSDETEGTVTPERLTFTPENWRSPQIVTVTGVDDGRVDGDTTYTISLSDAVSDDPAYDGLPIEAVSAVNTDDDNAGILVSPTSGLQTSELGATATFTVVLTAAPADDVTISIVSSDTGEGTTDTDELVFTPEDWDEPQVVTVTGVDDDDGDGPVAYTILTEASSEDEAYDGAAVADVAVTNLDDEASVPAVLVSPTGGLQTTEAGGEATFSIFLGTQPISTVGLSLTVGDTTEGAIDETTLIFSTANWSTPQTVTVTGRDDGIDDGDVTYTIAISVVSTDPDYAALEVPDVSVTNGDDDEVGITVEGASDILQTSEYGDGVTFTVVLDCQPSSTVTIPLSTSDETEGTVSPVNLSFGTADWDEPRTVTVTGVNDTAVDGDTPYTVRIEPSSSTDAAYDGLDAPDVIMINTDNDPAVPCGNPDMIDDMEDGNRSICENGGRTGEWYGYNETSSAIQTVEAALLDGPREDSIVVMETVGSGVSGWGATMGVSLYGADIATRLPYDISGYTGIRFWAKRGEESSYPGSVKVHIVQENTANTDQGGTCSEGLYECSDHYADSISVTSTWKKFELPFSGFYQASGWGTSFPRDLENVLGFEFLIDYSSFDLMIDDLELY